MHWVTRHAMHWVTRHAMHWVTRIQNPVCFLKFRYIEECSRLIQTFSAVLWYFWTLCNSCIFRILSYSCMTYCVTLAYSGPCHIQNHGICRTRDIFRTLPRHILTYSKCCVALAYSYFLNSIFRISAYLVPEAYLITIVIIT